MTITAATLVEIESVIELLLQMALVATTGTQAGVVVQVIVNFMPMIEKNTPQFVDSIENVIAILMGKDVLTPEMVQTLSDKLDQNILDRASANAAAKAAGEA